MENTEADDSTVKNDGGKSRGGKGRGGKGNRKGGYGNDSVGATREENGFGEGNEGGNDEDKAGRGGKERGGKGGYGKGGKRGRPAGDSVADGEDAEGARGGKERGSKGGRGSKGSKSKGSHRAEHQETAGEASEAVGDNDQEDGRRGKNRAGKGDRGHKGGGSKGGGQARESRSGGYHNEAPMMLGDYISPALPGVPPASGGPKQCLLCCQDAPSYVSVGPCGHADACWVCAVRLRALSNDNCCPVCKVEAEEILITDDASLPFPASSRLSGLPGDSALGIRFANEQIERAVMRLFEYRCRLDRCAYSDIAFRSLWELENHLWKVHWRQFCSTCLKGRASFICEQVVYTQRDIQRHCRFGDRASNIGGRDVPGVPAHSWCEFCKQYFRDDDDLLYHMHTRHHLCQICGGQQNQFYPNFRCLASHFAELHYVCPHPDCAHDGHRLTVFATPDELELHRLSAHTDKSQMTEKEKKATSNLRAFELTGFRSYADQRATASESKGGGKGAKGRGAQESSGFAVRFCYPKLADELGIEPDEAEDAEPDTGYNRYQDRAVLPDPTQEMAAVQENQTEQHEEEAGGKQEGEDDDSETDEDDLNDELDKGLRDLPLQATVAKSGRQEGMLCCLDALQAVLQALLPGKPQLSADDLQALREVTSRLTLIEADTMERLRKDLASCSPSDCDWEPLERVLALRPFFFRLLRHAKGIDSRTRTIGPKSGDSKGSTDDSKETDWATWKYAAQLSVKALGHDEQQWLRAYVHFSLERRAALSSGLGGVLRADASQSAAAGQKKDVQMDVDLPSAAEFPTLGGDAEGSAIAEVAASTWGRPKKQAPPSLLVQPLQPARPARAKDSWDDDDSPVAAANQEPPQVVEENFPSLGGGSSSAARQTPGWGAAGKTGATAKAKANAAATVAKPKASVPQQTSNFPSLGSAKTSASPSSAGWGGGAATAQAAKPKAAEAKPKSAAANPGVADFPTLGAKAAASSAPSWGAEARERAALAAKAKSEPPKVEAPKEFQVVEDAFPDLPLGAVKPKQGAPKAGARAQQKAKAKSNQDAKSKASAQVAVEEPAEEPQVELVPDDQLVVIHDPLEAVAKTEAMEAERRARKGKKPGGKSRVANPWMAGSSSVNAWRDK
eukprot:TRINITY_DN26011_c0_g1_i1.p1 TRINITY_DN26011_c0_g1~~TRINITY_DN26011_c0_g1_i1.p1  ORF type:complete len:1132 (-),score=214.51 TRINITY_DN26011_c0_g1_i1:142-3537(-)